MEKISVALYLAFFIFYPKLIQDIRYTSGFMVVLLDVDYSTFLHA